MGQAKQDVGPVQRSSSAASRATPTPTSRAAPPPTAAASGSSRALPTSNPLRSQSTDRAPLQESSGERGGIDGN